MDFIVTLIQWIVDRLKEPSTSASIAAIVAGWGWSVDISSAVLGVIVSVFAALGIILKEKAKKSSGP